MSKDEARQDYHTESLNARTVHLTFSTLATLAEYATATDAEVADRGMGDLEAVLPEVREILGWAPPQDPMEGNRMVQPDE